MIGPSAVGASNLPRFFSCNSSIYRAWHRRPLSG
ncbi:unnamed protein product [Penicillium roqueforti FM164]|uniref:Uncharacterized protein n=1 Tax=Penicillium roqueforti (strain FM164) TaxID=1365484 RepID=W6QPV3_PENRF|nr:unnamed protein product [Penicillium roqueforti FM164]